MAINYVKFFRGSPLAFENVIKNNDTLYFITETDSNKGSLYLGNKLISGNIADITDLEDVLFTNLDNGDLLTYDENNQKWVNKSIIDAIGLMVGAKEDIQGGAGLVPAPGIGQQNSFLRGDGTWAEIASTGSDIQSDNKTIETASDGITISLKNYGKQYYRRTESGEYQLQIVNIENPWIEGLEPRVVEENGELILGWFEPSSTTVEGISSQLDQLQLDVSNLEIEVSGIKTDLNAKANSNSVYTKDETDIKIAEAIAASSHLQRKTFDSLIAAYEFIRSIENPQDYIYMVVNSESSHENDTYLEYIYIDGALELVGSWDVDLNGYAKIEDLNKYVEKLENYTLISVANVAKLEAIEEGAQKNLFDSVNGSEFFIDVNRQLNLQPITISKVQGLNDILENKANQFDLQTIQGEMTALKSTVTELNQKVGNLEVTLKDNYIDNDQYNKDMAELKQAMSWQDLPNT